MKSTLACALLLALSLSACSGVSGSHDSSAGFVPANSAIPDGAPVTKIDHVVIVVQENRSYDNLFATFGHGADGTTTGVTHTGATIPLKELPLNGGQDLNHMHSGFLTSCDFDSTHACKMDGFDQIGFGSAGTGGPAGTYPYQYIRPTDIAPYWNLAKAYVLADHLFQTQGSGSYTA